MSILKQMLGTEKKERKDSRNPLSAIPSQTRSCKTDWDTMPDESCQYNFKGTYFEYFSHVFGTEFPEYDIIAKSFLSGTSAVYVFRRGETTALVVQVLSENSTRKALRAECFESGIPYLRFYHNHRGWWNTRSYVTDRVRTVLGDKKYEGTFGNAAKPLP